MIELVVGRGHELNDAEIEILVEVYDDHRASVIFHCNYLSEKFREYRKENPDGWLSGH